MRNPPGRRKLTSGYLVEKAINSMKNRKAAGPEGIPAELLKNITENLKECLQYYLKNMQMEKIFQKTGKRHGSHQPKKKETKMTTIPTDASQLPILEVEYAEKFLEK